MSIAELYEEFQDKDGFLYSVYSAENFAGWFMEQEQEDRGLLFWWDTSIN